MFEWEEIKLGSDNDPYSADYYDCFACRKQLVVRYNRMEDFTHDSTLPVAVARGWRRRWFHTGADPWFCSEDCAYNSPQALYCIEYWAKHTKEYDDKNSFFGKIKGWFK